jgi:dipeptidyl aminopeptidase/acylaminoacyl peptidase
MLAMLAGGRLAMIHSYARAFLSALLVCFLALPAGAATLQDRVARRAAAFGSLPSLLIPELSPDGAFIASLDPVNGKGALVVRPRDHPEDARIIFEAEKGRLSWFAWVGAERLMVEESFSGWRGTATVETRMYAVNRDGSHPVMLLTPRGKGRLPQAGSMVTSFLPNDPDHVLMSWDGNLDGALSLYRVDVQTGRALEIERGTKNAVRWLADRSGMVRLRIDAVGVDKEIWVRDGAEAPWRLLLRYDMLKGPRIDPRFFAPENPDLLYVLSDRGDGRRAAYTIDLKTGAFVSRLFSDPHVDVQSIIQTRTDGRAIGFLRIVDSPSIHYLDQTWIERQAAVDAVLPETTNLMVSESEDGRYHLVVSIGPREPGRYYVRDEATGRISLVGQRYPGIVPSAIGNVVAFPYTARDGVTIPAYLTLPPGVSLADAHSAKRPLVVLPHGGPHRRVSQDFDFLPQFIANLGYVVLQPNFRGSTGYGRTFETLGDRQWGRAMQDDLTDGAMRLIAEGVADPRRICIVGGSYGGYAALMGAVRTPDLYVCAVSIEGIADLKRFVSDLHNYRYADIRVPRIVDPDAIETVTGVSPVESAAAIKAPVLLIHGNEDAIVPIAHSLAMAKALRRARKTVEFDVLDGGDHQLNTEDVRIEALERLGRFLERYLGPEAPTVTDVPKA